LTDTQQQRQLNEAAEEFANAVKESYQVLSERGVSAQELNAELTENFFNSVINNLRTQAQENRELTQQLADQQQRAQEATQTLTQESVDAYLDFVNSSFGFWQGGIQAAKEAERKSR
jgi:aromatic ring-opening dioxygenase LigB subunit